MSEKMATAHVPYLLDLVLRPSDTTMAEPGSGAAQAEPPSTRAANTAASAEPKPGDVRFRPKWKHYVRSVLPHAYCGINNCLLTCLAEGRVADDDDEASMAKGPAVVCHLFSQACIQR